MLGGKIEAGGKNSDNLSSRQEEQMSLCKVSDYSLRTSNV